MRNYHLKRIALLCCLVLLICLRATPAESVPNLISYQGILKDADGNPVPGPVSITFSVYDVESEGTAMWSEDHDDVALNKGHYNVLMGDGNTVTGSFDPNLFSADDRWLEVVVDGEALTPRIRFTSVAFSFKAEDADTVDGKHAADIGVPSGFMIMGETPDAPLGYTYTGMILDSIYESAWLEKAPMNVARSQFATAVVNGKIYAIGGYDGSNYLDVNEEYDPVANTWTTKDPMPNVRGGLAVAVVNGKIYAIGGYDGSNYLNINEEYDPVENTWTTKAPMPTERQGLGAAVVNGKIYAIGGFNSSNQYVNEVYDPDSGTWDQTKAPIPETVGFSNYVPTVVLNGNIYVFLSSGIFKIYDPLNDSWTPMTNKPSGISSFGEAVVSNEKIFGFVSQITFEYDPVTNMWTQQSPLPTGRCNKSVAAVNGKIYVIGGQNISDWICDDYVGTNEEFTPGGRYYLHRKD